VLAALEAAIADGLVGGNTGPCPIVARSVSSFVLGSNASRVFLLGWRGSAKPLLQGSQKLASVRQSARGPAIVNEVIASILA
jgi:hypothetical protein